MTVLMVKGYQPTEVYAGDKLTHTKERDSLIKTVKSSKKVKTNSKNEDKQESVTVIIVSADNPHQCKGPTSGMLLNKILLFNIIDNDLANSQVTMQGFELTSSHSNVSDYSHRHSDLVILCFFTEMKS